MANNCSDNTLNAYNGTSQWQRALAALVAECPKVDERTPADLILLTKKYGAYLNYYDLTNTIAGDWQGIMGQDMAVVIATIADWKTTDYAPFITDTDDSVIAATTDAGAQQYFKVLFDFIFSLATGLDQALRLLPANDEYATFLSVSATSKLASPLSILTQYYQFFKANSLIDETITFADPLMPVDTLVLSQNFQLSALSAPFIITPTATAYPITLTSVLRTDINHVVTHNLFTGAYQSFIDGVVNIVSRTQAFLADAMDKYAAHTPHYALYLSFLKLFKFAQNHLNHYTKRHLDFYYKDVLNLTNSPAEADFVHLIFTLQKNIDQHLLEQGDQFKAGKDANNNDLFYALTDEIVVQTASVTALKSLYLAEDSAPVTLYASPVANSQDGQGTKLLSADNSWYPFGSIQNNILPAAIGFALASNVLYMNEGTRTITLTFNCNSLNGIAATDLLGMFTVQLTGKKAWYTPAANYTATVSGNAFTLTVTLEGNEPAIIPFSSKIHTGNFPETLPMVQVMLTSYTSYQKIQLVQITQVNIAVNVSGVKNLVLQNDDGKINAAKPFKTFGDYPEEGASFIIGSKEIFQKSLDSLTINFDWQQEPLSPTTVNLSSLAMGNWQALASDAASMYTSALTINMPAPLTGGFKLIEPLIIEDAASKYLSKIDLLSETDEPEVSLMDLMPEELIMLDPWLPIGVLEDLGLPGVSVTASGNLEQSEADFTPNADYDVTAIDGFIKLELVNSNYNLSTYLNSITPPSVNVNYDPKTNKVSSYTVSKVAATTAPNPIIKSISVSYKAEDNFYFTDNANAFNGRSNFYYHVEPFGFREMHPYIIANDPLTLLPIFNLNNVQTGNDGGELWIGLSNALADETFSVLFQLSDGSANPLKSMTTVSWYYLSANNWLPFNNLSVTDQTNNLTSSGLMVFLVPADATLTNTRADNGLIWIKGVVSQDTDAVCNLIAVDVNAAKAQFVQDPTKNIAFTAVLPPNTISKPAIADAALKQTQQPYNSFGGRVLETDEQFYVRVSERLRHKHRAITTWDYERLTLQYFPQIFKVKCINHTGFVLDEKMGTQKYCELLAGSVMVITIPDLTNLNTANPLRPYTSIGLLTDIQEYLQTLTSPFVKLNLCNPQFEEVQFDFYVMFTAGSDPVYFTNQLNNDIEQFLTPWAYGDPQAITFGNTIEKSVVLNFVEERSYVDYVTCFKMNQIIRDGTTVISTFYDLDEAVASTARSILVSYYNEQTKVKHLITSGEKCDCNG